MAEGSTIWIVSESESLMERRGVLHSLQEVAKSGLAVLQCGQFIITSGQGGSDVPQTVDYPAYQSCLQLLEKFNVRFTTHESVSDVASDGLLTDAWDTIEHARREESRE